MKTRGVVLLAIVFILILIANKNCTEESQLRQEQINYYKNNK